MRWRDLVIKTDPDIIIGYNICKFDLPYLIDRAEALGLKEFPYWGRLRGSKLRMRDTTFSSKAYGTKEYKEITIEGRVQLDMLMAIQRDHKLSSYSLNSVSATFLGEQKEDVHHSCIADLQNGNEETRRRLAVYCLKAGWGRPGPGLCALDPLAVSPTMHTAGCLPAAAAVRQAHVHVQLHRGGQATGARSGCCGWPSDPSLMCPADVPCDGRATVLPARSGPVDQGVQPDPAQGPDQELPGAQHQVRRRSGRRCRLRGRNGPGGQGRLLRAAGRHAGLCVPLPVHHDGSQPLLLDPAATGGRGGAAPRRVHTHSQRRLLCQARAAAGHPARDPGGAAGGPQARPRGPEEGDRPVQEGGAGWPAAGPQGQRQLGLRLHGRHRGQDALPGDLVVCDSLRPDDDRAHPGPGAEDVHPGQRLLGRLRGGVRRHRLGHGQLQGRHPGGCDGHGTEGGRLHHDNLPQADQARVREGVLALPAHQQEAVRRPVLDPAGKV